jgi:hypothetical protein
VNKLPRRQKLKDKDTFKSLKRKRIKNSWIKVRTNSFPKVNKTSMKTTNRLPNNSKPSRMKNDI